MKRISLAIALLLIISLLLPAIVLAHGEEKHMTARPMKNTGQMTEEMTKEMQATKAQPTDKTLKAEIKQPQESTRATAAISAENLYKVRDAGIFSLFLMMMAIGFAGFVGYSRRYNI